MFIMHNNTTHPKESPALIIPATMPMIFSLCESLDSESNSSGKFALQNVLHELTQCITNNISVQTSF